jgi:outer membrane protein assembly factor BamB
MKNSLLSLLIVCACGSTFSADWPQYRGPNRDNRSPEKGWLTQWPKEGPKQLWKANVGVGSAPVSIAGGKLYTMGYEGTNEHVVCLDALIGKEVWKHSYPSERFDNMHEGGPACAPSIEGDSVYAIARGGSVMCLSIADGKPKWSVNLVKEFGAEMPFFAFCTSPLVLGDKVIVIAGAKGASTVALDKKSGKTLWKSGDDPAGYASPAPYVSGKDTHLAIFNGTAFVILNSDTGAQLARLPWETPSAMNSHVNATSPVIDGKRIFISAAYGMGSAMVEIDLTAGKINPLWKADDFETQYNTAQLVNGNIYGFHTQNQGDTGGEMRCLDGATGATKWTQKNPNLGSLIESDGKLFIVTRRGELILMEPSPEKYKELARVQITGGTCRSEPTLCDSKLYIRNVRGDVHCLDLSGK